MINKHEKTLKLELLLLHALLFYFSYNVQAKFPRVAYAKGDINKLRVSLSKSRIAMLKYDTTGRQDCELNGLRGGAEIVIRPTRSDILLKSNDCPDKLDETGSKLDNEHINPRRGVGTKQTNQTYMNQKQIQTKTQSKNLTRILGTSFVTYAMYVIYDNRNSVPSKDEIQTYLLNVITKVQQKGRIGLLYYILGLAFCESIGITTGPIETTGGFVFGLQNGFFANAAGKLSGALTTYFVGRTYLSSKIQSKLKTGQKSRGNESSQDETTSSSKLINLVQKCIIEEPFTTTIILRFSFFPQVVKNLILSVLEPVTWKLFLVATSIQALPYSLLFTVVGHDSARRLNNPSLPMNIFLNGCLLAITLYGIFGTPALVAYWYQEKSKKYA